MDASEIMALRIDAGEHGDMAQVALCDAALDGDECAVREIARVIADAQARATDAGY
jgi:hypothetical protein